MNDGNPLLGASSSRPSALALLAVAIFLVAVHSAPAATITTYAGGGGTDADNIPATNSVLLGMEGLALDPAGNLLIAHYTGARIRRVDHATGIITSFAGTGVLGYGGEGGPATNAVVNGLLGIAVSGTGDLFLADSGNDCGRKITADRGRFAVNWFKIAGGGGDSGGGHALVGLSTVTLCST